MKTRFDYPDVWITGCGEAIPVRNMETPHLLNTVKMLVRKPARVKTFGECFSDYSDTVKNVDPAVVEASANAAQAVIKLAKEIPSQGGVLQWLLGSQDIGAFGAQLKTFGECFVNYSDTVKGIDPSVVEVSANAAQALVALAQDIPTSGGFVSWLLGDNDMGTFGENLEIFGESFKGYYDSISDTNLTVVGNANSKLRDLIDVAGKMEDIDLDAVEDFGEAVQDLGEDLGETNWSNLSADFSSGMSDLLSSLNQTISEMQTGMDDLESKLNTVWGNIATNASTKWENVKTEIDDNNNSACQNIAGKWNPVENALNTIWGRIATSASTKWKKVKTEVENSNNSLYQNITKKWISLEKVLSTHCANIKKNVTSSFTEMKKSAISRASEMASGVSNPLSGLATKAYHEISGAGCRLRIHQGYNARSENESDINKNVLYVHTYLWRATL